MTKEQTNTKNTNNAKSQHANGPDESPKQSRSTFWNNKEYSDIVFYLFIAIFLLELVVAGVAFFYGIIHAVPDPNGGAPRFQFPWLAYVLAAVLAPAGLLLILHLSGVDVFSFRRGRDDEAWQAELPTRLRKAYIIIKNAPTIVLLVGVLLLGAALVYVDGALNALFQLSDSIGQYLPWIIGGIVVVWCVTYMGRVWFAYRSKRVEEEYAFRREIFERTGQILVDRGTMQLPPQEQNIAIEAATVEALPVAEPDDTVIVDAKISDKR